jgi:hypothetical protein
MIMTRSGEWPDETAGSIKKQNVLVIFISTELNPFFIAT